MGYGKHLTLDFEGCPKNSIDKIYQVYKLLEELPKLIGMTIIRPPNVQIYNPLDNPREWGVTGDVIIAESHIAIHTYPEKNFVFMDIFSCKTFNHKKAIKHLSKAFKPKDIKKNVIMRGKNFPK